jgi:hypothetical protein
MKQSMGKQSERKGTNMSDDSSASSLSKQLDYEGIGKGQYEGMHKD